MTRYIPVLDDQQRAAIQSVLDAHQPGAYVMYPAFTSSSWHDAAIRLWLRKWHYQIDIAFNWYLVKMDSSANSKSEQEQLYQFRPFQSIGMNTNMSFRLELCFIFLNVKTNTVSWKKLHCRTSDTDAMNYHAKQ